MRENNNWLEFAYEDLEMAELALDNNIYNQVCFHSQQAVEKSLKGYLKNMGILPPKTHKLVDIISLIKEDLLDDLKKEQIILLDRFYIPTRYPDALPGTLPDGLPTEKDAKEALNLAKEIVEIINPDYALNIANDL
jgi:HEPN domain-containing protein